MALNLSDPATIIAAYESIIARDSAINWLLLKYSNHDELSLFKTGSDGLRELKHRIDELDQIFIAFYRAGLGPGEERMFALVNYIPTTVSGVRRARVLVHSRRIEAAVFKHHHTTLTIEHLEQLSSETIRNSHNGFEDTNYISMGRTSSQPNQAPLAPIRRSFSETYAPHVTPPAPPVTKSASMFSSFMRRKKKADDSNDEDEDADPPPAPPKDKGKYGAQRAAAPYDYMGHSEPQPIPPRKHNGSISEYAVVSHSASSDEVLVEAMGSEKPIIQILPLRGKWSTNVVDPAERLRRTREARRQRLIEEQQALREEEERKAERRRQREAQIREEMEYEARKRASLEEEVKRLTTERKKKEQLEKEEEERKTREFEERKRLERERRMLEHRKLEAWRQEQARLADEAARRSEEARQREEDERRKKISIAEAKVKRNGADSLLTGWVTMQMNESLFWKRRYFKFIGSTAYFYRSPTDMHQILEKVELRGKLRGLREWNEGYEDLEAIPHSFAIEFKDERGSWSMYADSEEEKYKLLGLLHHAAGL